MMKLKKYIATSLQEGKNTILKELGPDAIILSTRQIKKHGNIEGDFVEIVAAIDDSIIAKEESISKPSLRSPKHSSEALEQFSAEVSKIYLELNNIKAMLSEVNENIKFKYSASLGEVYGKLYKILLEAGYSEEFALNVVGRISSANLNLSFEEAFHKAKEIIVSEIEVGDYIEKKDELQLCAFIGPSGGGKTTTLIKLAIICKLVHKAEVLIISADTNKIGGAEQLQLFASIANIPYKAIYSAEEFKNAILEKGNVDFIFVDTYGASPQDDRTIEEITKYLSVADFSYKYFVLPANLSKQSLLLCLDKFAKTNYSSVIMSKTDEIDYIGNALTVLAQKKVKLSYITNGQKLPEDIEPAEQFKLQEIVLPEILLMG